MSRKKPIILVVDDDKNSRIAVKAVLDSLDVDVIEAESGEQALREVLRHNFAMIILDVKMKGMNGFETATAIRERDSSRDIPIIFLTGFEKDELNINRGYDLGAVDYMLKPIVADSLRAKVKFSIKYHVQLLAALEKEKNTAKELASLVAELSRSNKALDEFAYVASHDLREPLRGITINANFILKGEPEKRVRERVSRMIDLSMHMDELISDLLLFSRLGQIEEQSLTSDISQTLDGCRQMSERLQHPETARLIVHGDFPKVYADPVHVRTVFQNLIANGLQYNKSALRTVEVGFAEKRKIDGTVRSNIFYVRDNGIGIAPEFHEKIFAIFTRLNPKREFDVGSGAGLSFVKRILDGYGCDIDVSSSPGEGALFYFTLPLKCRVAKTAISGAKK